MMSGSYMAPFMKPPFSTEPEYGLKLRVNAASPDPVITRHGCAPAAGFACCAGRADAPGARIAATAATAPITHAVTRPERAARAGLLILPTPFGSSPAPAARGGSSTDSSRHPRPSTGSHSFHSPPDEACAGNVYQIVSMRSRPIKADTDPFRGFPVEPNDVFLPFYL